MDAKYKTPLLFSFFIIVVTFFVACSKKAEVVPKAIAPDSVKYSNYLVKKGTITIKYGDSTIVFTAPQDSIVYQYSHNGGYYSLISAFSKKAELAISLGSKKPELLTVNDFAFPCGFYLSDQSNWTEYIEGFFHGNEIDKSSIQEFNDDDVLMKATFQVNVTDPGDIDTSFNLYGTIELYQ